MADTKPEDPRKAGIPEPLRTFVDIDRDGYVSISYPMLYGWLLAEIGHASSVLGEAMARKGKEREARLKSLQSELADSLGKHTLIGRQWDEFREARDAARKAARHG